MNKQIIDQLLLLATQFKQDGNTFKASALFKGLSIIKKLDYEIEDITQIEKIKGIGKGICKRVNEILETGKLSELNKQSIKINFLKPSINTDDLWDSWLTLRSRSIFMDVGSMNIQDIDEKLKNL